MGENDEPEPPDKLEDDVDEEKPPKPPPEIQWPHRSRALRQNWPLS
jgi:hypothetical protein